MVNGDLPTTAGFALHLRRSLTASPVRVWRSLTDPAELTAWFWPASLRPRVDADARPGHVFRIESAAMAVGGRYETVVEPHLLVYGWRWDGADTDETVVTIELSAMDGGTSLDLRHDGFPDRQSRDDHIKGWSDCLDRLPAHLAADA